MMRAAGIAVALVGGAFGSCDLRRTEAPMLEVFAASSLAELVGELGAEREQNDLAPFAVQFGGSNTLARQIAAGAQADLFLSADEASARSVSRGAETALWLTNELVVVAPASGGPESLDAAIAARVPIAVGGPGVPAGEYARAALGQDGRLERAKGLLVEFSDVRAALAQVEAGAVPCGIVYRTDALGATGRVRVLEPLPLPAGEPVSYVMVALTARGAAEMRRLLADDRVWAAAARLGFQRHPRAGAPVGGAE